MQEIIEPIDRVLLLSELRSEFFVRKTNNGNNEIYILDAHRAPNLMKEIGRLRELTFRQAGGGTGKAMDVDSYDLAEIPYQQLIVWNPEDAEIIGGYRFFRCWDAPAGRLGLNLLATSGLFEFSDRFIKDYLPYTIELGRSFVQPKYQPGNSRKGLFSLDNIWDGLGAITIENPRLRYFFGKVTMYLHYNREARDLVLYFLKHFFPDHDELLKPLKPLGFHQPEEQYNALFPTNDFKEGFKILNQKVREKGENIPPLVNIYMNLSPTMKSFGTVMNHTFGDVEETGILVTVADIYPEKTERHVTTYNPDASRIKG